MKTINSKVYKDSVRWLGALEELIETMQVGGRNWGKGVGGDWGREVGNKDGWRVAGSGRLDEGMENWV